MVTSRAVSRRSVEIAGRIVAIIVLLLILANATLVDRVPPSVQSISLGRTTGDSHVGLTHTAIDVEFSKAVDQSSAQLHFHIVPAVQGAFAWDGSRTMIFTPNQKLPSQTQFTVTIQTGFRDVHGNVANGGPTTFTFRTIGPPVLSSSSPSNGAADVPVDTPISLTFDRLMDVGKTGAAISVSPSVALKEAWSGATVSLTPTTQLAYGTVYTVTVSTAAVDTDGNSPARPIVVTFTTVRAGLSVSRVVPSDGSAGAPVDGSIAIVFSAPVDPTSVSGLVRITPSAPGQLSVQAIPSDVPGQPPPQSVVVYQPSASLAPHTTYTVQLLDGVKGADDPRLVAAGRTWSFTTGAPAESLQNQVLFLSARTGVQNLWAMNPDGTNARQLTDSLAPVTAYDVTADGQRVVYASAGHVQTFTLGSPSPTDLTPGDSWDYAPRLLPDGSGVIVGRRARATGADRGWWLLPIESNQQPRQIVPAGAPPSGSTASTGDPLAAATPDPWTPVSGVSADGSTAVVVGAGGEIVRVDLASGKAADTGLQAPTGPMQWSDVEHGFVVDATRDGEATSAVWVIPVNGPPITMSVSGGGPWTSVAPQAALAWLSGTGVQHVAYEPRDGRQASALTSGSELSDRQPSFSPAGDVVVFVRVPGAGGASAGIWAVGTNGRGLRELSPDGSQPRWLP